MPNPPPNTNTTIEATVITVILPNGNNSSAYVATYPLFHATNSNNNNKSIRINVTNGNRNALEPMRVAAAACHKHVRLPQNVKNFPSLATD